MTLKDYFAMATVLDAPMTQTDAEADATWYAEAAEAT
jgi:hypothetical protein